MLYFVVKYKIVYLLQNGITLCFFFISIIGRGSEDVLGVDDALARLRECEILESELRLDFPLQICVLNAVVEDELQPLERGQTRVSAGAFVPRGPRLAHRGDEMTSSRRWTQKLSQGQLLRPHLTGRVVADPFIPPLLEHRGPVAPVVPGDELHQLGLGPSQHRAAPHETLPELLRPVEGQVDLLEEELVHHVLDESLVVTLQEIDLEAVDLGLDAFAKGPSRVSADALEDDLVGLGQTGVDGGAHLLLLELVAGASGVSGGTLSRGTAAEIHHNHPVFIIGIGCCCCCCGGGGGGGRCCCASFKYKSPPWNFTRDCSSRCSSSCCSCCCCGSGCCGSCC